MTSAADTDDQARPRGRPAGKDYPHLVNIRMSDDMIEALDAIRKRRSDKPNRTVLVRELLRKAIEQEA